PPISVPARGAEESSAPVRRRECPLDIREDSASPPARGGGLGWGRFAVSVPMNLSADADIDGDTFVDAGDNGARAVTPRRAFAYAVVRMRCACCCIARYC